MKFRISYYEQSGKYRTAEVEAADKAAAIELLANDEQHPLAQEGTVEVLDEQEAS